jgi:Ca-activated chloride channel family protein
MRALLLVALAVAPLAPHPLPSPRATAPVIVVYGAVRDSNTKAALAGVAVQIRNSSSFVLTDAGGRYRLTLTGATAGQRITVVARRLGYQLAAREIAVEPDSTRVDLALLPMSVQLEQVVVTAEGASSIRIRGLSSSSMYGSTAANGPIVVATGGAALERDPNVNTEEYESHPDNEFVAVTASPRSTFSVDVDRASYSNVRRFIADGKLPPRGAVRIEELINYFPYDYAAPPSTSDEPVAVTTNVAAAPWTPTHRVVRIGLQTPRIETAQLPASNLVFLIDVSGSMSSPNKLPLVKSALRLLVAQLRPQDRVAIVVYAGNAGLVLPSTSGSDKEKILDVIDRLEAGGSTAGGEGIRLAYDIAKSSFIRGGNNRVVLATDGDFNVGVSSTSELVDLVTKRRAEGTALTVLGFGMGNLKDSRMEQLADKGDGNYAYIESLAEARKVLVQEMGGTLVTVAKDVKLQVEFNPTRVASYRLIGYEDRLLRTEDFANDAKDAGDMGAGHSVTAIYEIIPASVRKDSADARGSVAPLRYQQPGRTTVAARSDELLTVSIRYKPPRDSAAASRLVEHIVRDELTPPPTDFRFALAVAGYGMILRDSPHRGHFTYADVEALAQQSLGADPDHYRAAFVDLVRATSRLGVASR